MMIAGRQKYKLFMMFFVLKVSSALATVFSPISFEKQLSESDAVIEGIYHGLDYKKLPDGQIVTELSFKLVTSAGLPMRYLVNHADFKALIPGGVWQGVIRSVEGVPTYKEGQHVVVLLKKANYGYWVYSLGLGSYNVEFNKRKKVAIKNYIFKNHPKLGNIKWDFLQVLIETRFGKILSSQRSDKVVYTQKENEPRQRSAFSRSRSPSSEEENDDEVNSEPTSELNATWLVFILGGLGLLMQFFRRRSHNRE